GMTTLYDVFPTVVDALEIPTERELPGKSLIPLIENGGGTTESVFLTECTWLRKQGWRTSRWKLVEALEPDIYGTQGIELYNLETDPAEKRNLAQEAPEIVRSLPRDRDEHIRKRLAETGLPNPLVEQADALRTWQPRFITGKT